MRRTLGLAAFLLAAAMAACSPRGCRPTAPAFEELLQPRLPVADKRWNGILVEFGSPAALPLLGEGWSYGEGGFRWAVRESASFRFESEREGQQLGWLDCEPFRYEGGPAQWVGVVLNGVELPPVELRDGRDRYPVTLPLMRGVNHAELRFRYAGNPQGGGADKRRLAVAFHRFEVPFDDWSGRVGPFAPATPDAGEPGVFLPPHGSLSFFVELPRRVRLRVRLGAEAPVALRAPPGAAVAATLRSEAGEIWSERFEVTDGGSAVWERSIDAGSSTGPFSLRFEALGDPVLLRPEALAEEGARPEPAGGRRLSERPDIVIVVLDGANALRMGLYGSAEETTPVLDALGRESVVFDVAVSQAVYTIASVGSLLTGQYPDRHQSVSFADRLRDGVVTFPALLTRAGYRTAAFPGNAVVSKIFGLDRGYEEFFPVWESGDYTGHGDSVARAFRSWHRSLEDEPFLAYVHFREPHFPYNPPPPFDTSFGPATPYPEGIREASIVDELNRSAAFGRPPSPEALARIRGLYHGNLAYVDRLVGEVVSELDPATVLIVTADHGEALFEHGFLGHNTQLYEESIRIPLLIRAPGIAPRRVSDVVELLDLSPTILELAGLGADSAARAMQGRSLVPLLSGTNGTPGRLAFSRTVWDRPRYSVRGSRFKLIWDSRSGASELYDLEADPGERENLVGERPIREGFLRQELLLWYVEQERLKSLEPPPDGAVISEDERRVLDSLGYADHVRREESETDSK